MRQPGPGDQFGERALLELTPEFREKDPQGAHPCAPQPGALPPGGRRRVPKRMPHVREAAAIAAQRGSPRALIAADTTRATYKSRSADRSALTRIDQAACAGPRGSAALHDTLGCAIRAEEAAGNAARALSRLEDCPTTSNRTGRRPRPALRELASFGRCIGSVRELKQEQGARASRCSSRRPAHPKAGRLCSAWRPVPSCAIDHRVHEQCGVAR